MAPVIVASPTMIAPARRHVPNPDSADSSLLDVVVATPPGLASPLARRPYDLRHAAVSLRLNSVVPTTGVARRSGHSVAVLLKVYAHCIDGQADIVNKRIADTLGSADDAGT